MMKNKYRNFDEQVSDNVILVDILTNEEYDEIDSYEFEINFFEAVEDITTDAYIEKVLGSELPEDNEKRYEIVDEFNRDTCEQCYGFYKVELKNNTYTHEHSRLMIFWNNELDTYILPIWSQGMAWSMVGVQN